MSQPLPREEQSTALIEASILENKTFELLNTIRYVPIGDKAWGLDGSREIMPTEQYVDESGLSDCNFFLIRLHFKRLLLTLAYFEWSFDVTYEKFVKELIDTLINSDVDLAQHYKMRMLISKSGDIRIEAHPISTPLDIDMINHLDAVKDVARLDVSRLKSFYKVYVTTEPVLAGPFTSFKTTYRDHYNIARETWLDPTDVTPQEVLMRNTAGEIMEGTVTNVCFLRRKRWVTPSLESGCLCGVMRQWLLTLGSIEEGTIDAKSVKEGEPVLVFNAIQGISLGRIILSH